MKAELSPDPEAIDVVVLTTIGMGYTVGGLAAMIGHNHAVDTLMIAGSTALIAIWAYMYLSLRRGASINE